MQITMTERDKKLLAMLACVLILVGFVWYLIIPMSDQIEKLDEEIAIAEMDKMNMEIKISQFPITEKQNEELKVQVVEAATEYYDLMTSQDVDKELTNVVLKENLECVNLEIRPIALTEIKGYVRSSLVRQSEAEALLNSLAAAAAEGEETAPAPVEELVQDQIYSYEVKLTAEGEEEDYQNLIDLLTDGYPAILVREINYKESTPKMILLEDGTLVEEEPVRQLILGLELYMTDKSV